jgi:hypothetical protein
VRGDRHRTYHRETRCPRPFDAMRKSAMPVASSVYNKPKTIIDSQTISDRIAAIFAKQCRKKRNAMAMLNRVDQASSFRSSSSSRRSPCLVCARAASPPLMSLSAEGRSNSPAQATCLRECSPARLRVLCRANIWVAGSCSIKSFIAATRRLQLLLTYNRRPQKLTLLPMPD